MIQELLFTSYEGQGLRKGGGGFCTVLSTEGMAANTASALEKLSGYKHPFDLHDDRSQHNPVNYRHAILVLGGTTYHVLSRVADLRHEHTGRSNKLAHHVALGKRELPPGGPAHTLRHPGFSRTEWDRKVGYAAPPSLASLPSTEAQPVRCDAWARAAGDAGWAGAVAEELAVSPDAAAHVIYPLRTDCLALVDEVLRLLPPYKRWGITFSTYYTSAIPGSSCNLRFVLDGTPEAEKIRRDHRLWKVDLASPLSRAQDSPLAIAARTGELTHSDAAARPKMPARGARPGKSAAAFDDDDSDFNQAYPFDGNADQYDLAPLIAAEQAAGRRGGSGHVAPLLPASRPPARNGGSRVPLIAILGGLAACVLLMAIGGLIAVGATLAMGGGQPPIAEEAEPAPPEAPNTEPAAPANGQATEPGAQNVAPTVSPEGNSEKLPPGGETSATETPSENGQPEATQVNASSNSSSEGTNGGQEKPLAPAEGGNDSSEPVADVSTQATPPSTTPTLPSGPTTLQWAEELSPLAKPKAVEKEPAAATAGIVTGLPAGEVSSIRLIGPYALAEAEDPTATTSQNGFSVSENRIQVWRTLKDPIRGDRREDAVVASLSSEGGELKVAWSEEVVRANSELRYMDDQRPLLNALRLHVLAFKISGAQFYLPLMNPVVVPSIDFAPPDTRPMPWPDLDIDGSKLNKWKVIIRLEKTSMEPSITVGDLTGPDGKRFITFSYQDPAAGSVPLIATEYFVGGGKGAPFALNVSSSFNFHHVHPIVRHPYFRAEEIWEKAAGEFTMLDSEYGKEIQTRKDRLAAIVNKEKPSKEESSDKAALPGEVATLEAFKRLLRTQHELMKKLEQEPLAPKFKVIADYSKEGEKVPPVVIFESK